MKCFFLSTPNTNLHLSRHLTTHKYRSMPILSVNGTPFYFFVNLKQSEETIHRFLIPSLLNFLHQSYISFPPAYYQRWTLRESLSVPVTLWHQIHPISVSYLKILPPLSLFYTKILLFTGSFLLPFKHSLISSIKIEKENFFITFILMSSHFSLQKHSSKELHIFAISGSFWPILS